MGSEPVIITPLGKTTPKPVALIEPNFRRVTIATVDGVKEHRGAERVYRALKALEGHSVYVSSGLRHLVHATGAQCWTADLWRGRAVTMSLDGSRLKVHSLRRSIPTVDGVVTGTVDGVATVAHQFAALLEVTKWLNDQGVRSGSLSSMAFNLWRSTLKSQVDLGFNPQVAKASFFGGRKESSRPHSYSDQVSLDISGAYPFSMVSRPYAAQLRNVSRETFIDPEVAGVATVRVTVPESLPFPPLPVRLAPEMIQWRHGVIEGTYPWTEIAAAKSLGCDVEVLRCWAPLVEIEPFHDWYALTSSARQSMSPGAAKMVKTLSNLVWSSFAINGDDSGQIRWADDYGDEPVKVARAPKRMAQANTVHIAAETSARVRVRMLLEGLYGDAEPPCHIDTDGMIISRASLERRGVSPLTGGWRAKQHMSVCEIKAPQMYRYQCGPSCGKDHSLWHYVAAGTPSKYASELFTRHPGFQLSFHGLDTVISSSDYLGETQVRRYLEAVDDLERAAYGPRLG